MKHRRDITESLKAYTKVQTPDLVSDGDLNANALISRIGQTRIHQMNKQWKNINVKA